MVYGVHYVNTISFFSFPPQDFISPRVVGCFSFHLLPFFVVVVVVFTKCFSQHIPAHWALNSSSLEVNPSRGFGWVLLFLLLSMMA